MNGNSNRSTAAALGSLLVLAAAALAGCATTGGAATSASLGNAARPLTLEVSTPTGFIVCSGASASRFPQREEDGRSCRPSPTLLHAIY